LAQQLFQLHPPQEMINDRQRAHLIGRQLDSRATGLMPRLDGTFFGSTASLPRTCPTLSIPRTRSHRAPPCQNNLDSTPDGRIPRWTKHSPHQVSGQR
jgi:hypothetical protein